MKILHSFLAIGGGFLTMAVLVTLATILLTKLAPQMVREGPQTNLPYLFLNLGYSAAFATAGGYVTALLARADPIIHSLALAMVVLLLSALSALQLKGKQPVAYQLGLIALTPLAVLGGGLIRLKQLGYL